MSELVKMFRHEPTRPGGPTEADVHESQVTEWLHAGWLLVEDQESPGDEDIASKIESADTIEALRTIAEGAGLSVHPRASDVDKAKASLLEQLG